MDTEEKRYMIMKSHWEEISKDIDRIIKEK